MSIEVWPFLVSRNRYLDYRTVVAPKFICEAKVANLLARVAEGELTHPGQGFMREIIGSKAGDFTIAFRVIKATETDINPAGEDNILKDQVGREIYIFEGIVTKGRREYLALSDSDFQKIHQQLIAKYEEFWNLVDAAPANPSLPFSLNIENVTSPVKLTKLAAFDLNSKPLKSVSENIDMTEHIKPRKLPTTLLLPAILILLVIMGLVFGKVLFGNTISLGCATTFEEKIEFKTEDNKISDQLKKLKNEYSKNTNIYLSGFLKIKSSKNIENKEFPSKSEKQPTIKLSEDNRLHLNYHPIDLAITDIKNQRLSENSKLTLRLIDRSGCK